MTLPLWQSLHSSLRVPNIISYFPRSYINLSRPNRLPHLSDNCYLESILDFSLKDYPISLLSPTHTLRFFRISPAPLRSHRRPNLCSLISQYEISRVNLILPAFQYHSRKSLQLRHYFPGWHSGINVGRIDVQQWKQWLPEMQERKDVGFFLLWGVRNTAGELCALKIFLRGSKSRR